MTVGRSRAPKLCSNRCLATSNSLSCGTPFLNCEEQRLVQLFSSALQTYAAMPAHALSGWP